MTGSMSRASPMVGRSKQAPDNSKIFFFSQTRHRRARPVGFFISNSIHNKNSNSKYIRRYRSGDRCIAA